jgi:maleylacetate reductase
MAEEGVRAMAGALPGVAADPGDARARGRALYGAWLCGSCLGATTMGLHHKLAHVLGGTFGLPHAETHTVLLPYTLAHNAAAAPEAVSVLARALDTDDVPRALRELAGGLGAPRTLAELGMEEAGLARAATQVAAESFPNPREVTANGVLGLLTAAYEGWEPRSEEA